MEIHLITLNIKRLVLLAPLETSSFISRPILQVGSDSFSCTNFCENNPFC